MGALPAKTTLVDIRNPEGPTVVRHPELKCQIRTRRVRALGVQESRRPEREHPRVIMSLVACCFPISQEAQMLKACYPPAKQLPATSAPLSADDSSYKPLSQELSRLTYYASNKPGKLNRLAEELEERVAKEGRKAKAGYGKHRM